MNIHVRVFVWTHGFIFGITGSHGKHVLSPRSSYLQNDIPGTSLSPL